VILLDTNIVIDAHDRRSRFRLSSSALIADAIVTEGAAINAVALAELCAGQKDPEVVEAELRAEGLTILDLPFAAALICGRAYRRYRLARKKSGGGPAPHIPLPDFFIGAHAELMGWKLATRDTERYRLYFPNVELVAPEKSPKR
jgi:predicted nucleic acid-binding protein